MEERLLVEAEADAYFSLVQILSNLKENFLPSFKGIQNNFKTIEGILEAKNEKLLLFFRERQIELIHFGFRWSFCLFLREFPLYLSIILLDIYICLDVNINEFCNYMIIAMLN